MEEEMNRKDEEGGGKGKESKKEAGGERGERVGTGMGHA